MHRSDGTVSSPLEWVQQHAASAPERHALVWHQRDEYGYADLLERVRRAAASLITYGAGPTARIAYLGPNDPGMVVLALAAGWTGATFVPLNNRLAEPELAGILHDADAVLLVHTETYADVASNLASQVGVSHVALADALEASGADDVAPPPHVPAPDDPSIILYTSGTTGTPKGVIWSVRSIAAATATFAEATGMSAGEVDLILGPMSMAGPLFMLLVTLRTGGTVLAVDKFDPESAVSILSERKVALTAMTPLLAKMVVENPDFENADLTRLRFVAVGGGPISHELLSAFSSQNILVTQAWSMTETTAVATLIPLHEARQRLGSAGIALDGYEVAVVREDGSPTSPEEVGEIIVRGDGVTPGYWRNAVATEATIDADGWLRSGDAGWRDADGYLTVVDRIKDMIISGGFNVYSREVEDVLALAPGVAEVAVVGTPDPTYGEAVTACVRLEPGAVVTLEQLRDAARSALAGYKLPRRLEILDDLPRNASGKVMKPALRKLIQGLCDEPAVGANVIGRRS